MIRTALATALCLAAAPMAAQVPEFTLPAAAEQTVTQTSEAASTRLPIGPWTEAGFDRLNLAGAIRQTAWRIRGNRQTTLQILDPLRQQILAAGYEVLFECETDGCGGFDFRYETETLPEPEMHVDLGDFRYLAARRDRPSGGTDHVALIVSRSSESGFVQLTAVTSGSANPAVTASPSATTPNDSARTPAVRAALAVNAGDLVAQLENLGHVALDDLSFDTGAATLGPGDYASLSALAAYLGANPTRSVALVGHTDTQGSLQGNVVLSRDRAAAVRRHLIDTLGTDPARISAEGAGWLAPRASNLTPEGRAKNRRVEAVLTSTQ